MAPELINSIDSDELRKLAERVQQYQESKKLSLSGLLKRIPLIGSDKTYRRILKGELAELDLEKQLTNYRAAVAYIDSVGDSEERHEEIFDDFVGVLQLKAALLETFSEAGNARWILVEGDTGTGKSSARTALQEKYGTRLICVEASDAWKDSPMALLKEILKARGRSNLPASQYDNLAETIKELNSARIGVVIEEAHHLGPRGLNTVKTLINNTPGEFIGCALPSLWARLERTAYQECRQLSGNRLAARIKLGLRESDVKKMLDRTTPGLNGNSDAAIAMLMAKAPRYGNYKFVSRVCSKFSEMCEGEKPTMDLFLSAVAAEEARR